MFSFKKCISSIVMTLCVNGFSTAMGTVENSSPIKSIESFSEFHSDTPYIGIVCSPDCTGDNIAKGNHIQTSNRSLKNISVHVEIDGKKYSVEDFKNNSLQDMQAIISQYNEKYEMLRISYQLKTEMFKDIYNQYKFALLMRHGSTVVADSAYKGGNPTVSCSMSNITQMSNWQKILKVGTTIITSDLSRAKTTGAVLMNGTYETDVRLHELALPENYKNMTIEKMLEDQEVQKMCANHSYNIGVGESVKKKAEDVANCIKHHLTSTTTNNIISHVFVSHCISIGSFIAEYSNGLDYPGKIEREGIVCPPVTHTLDAALVAYNFIDDKLSIVQYPLASSNATCVKKLCMAFLEKTIGQIIKETPNDNG